jgi:hypothetical protein
LQVTTATRTPLQVHDDALARICELMAVANSAAAALVDLVAEVIEGGVWTGWRSPEHFVSWRCGISNRRARDLTTIARRRAELPTSMARFTEGRITEDQMAVIARWVPPDYDRTAADLALSCAVPQLLPVCKSMPWPDRPVGDSDREAVREVRLGTDDDGWWRQTACLPGEDGSIVEQALRAARDSVFRDTHPDATDDAPSHRVSWADAMVRMAECALEALDPATQAGRHPSERYKVLIHVRDDGRAQPHLGGLLPDAIRQYLACDCTIQAVVEHRSVPIALSAPTRTVPDRLRRLVEARDGGCRVPSCTQARWLQVHHIVHAADGGATILTNLVALCPHHHRLHHQGKLGIRGDPTRPDGLEFTDHHGRSLTPRPPPALVGVSPTAAADAAGLTQRHFGPVCERLQRDAVMWN